MGVGLELAEALEAARDGDLERVAALDWPDDGLLRAHLPRRWVVELIEAGRRAGRPPTIAVLERSPRPIPTAELSIGCAARSRSTAQDGSSSHRTSGGPASASCSPTSSPIAGRGVR